MPLKFLMSNGRLEEGKIASPDFIGSVHTKLNLDNAPDGIVVALPRTYAWNSISVYPEPAATFTIEQTISSPEEIYQGAAHWLQLEDYKDKSDSIFYMWEWPIIALRLKGSGHVNFDLVSKQF